MTPAQIKEIEQRWGGNVDSHWWCPACAKEVSCQCVTFDEHHDLCGSAVVWIDGGVMVADVSALLDEVRRLQCCGNCRQQEGNPYFECAYMDVESYNESGCKRCSEWEAAGNG